MKGTDEAYQILADLVFKGFITSEMILGDKRLVFKTISEHEHDLIRAYAGRPERKGYQLTFNIYFLIFSLFMVGNENILYQRTEKLPDLFDAFASLPEKTLTAMLTGLNIIRIASFEVLKYVEGFSYTNFARNAWKTLNGHLPSESVFTGIPGTDSMGMNIHQESWVLINRFLDEEDEYNKNFSFALMVSSASNPKGARQIRNNHDTQVKGSEDRRVKIAREGFIDVNKWSPEGWAQPVDTVEELVAELEREMQGHKDKHDIFIDKYLKSLRDRADQKVKAAEERIKKYRTEQGGERVIIDGYQRALTAEETRKLLSKKRSYTETVPDEEHTSPEDRDRFLKKTGARILGR